MVIEEYSVCSNFSSLVYTQCILARKAFYSTGSLKNKSKIILHFTDWGPFSPRCALYTVEVKIWCEEKHWDQAFLASHVQMMSVFSCGFHCIWFCVWFYVPLRYSQLKFWIVSEFQWGAVFQLWKICIQNKTKYQQIDKGKIMVPIPKWNLEFWMWLWS